jgi:serine/threonine protein kinase
MPTSELLDELMLRWEAARQQGKKLTAEEVCADAPQFAEEVRQRIRAVLAMEDVLGVTSHDLQRTLFWPHQGPPTNSEEEPLPRIPGYELIRVIDQGGMGVIYEARQIKLGRTVAIKMISGVRLRPKLVARFRTEAEAAARLQHPNFVQIFDVGEVNGRPYFSMEYVDGGSLADLLTQQSVSPSRAAELIETLAEAIHAAHVRGVVHRDLKPSNVMLTRDATPKIADFGLAKRLDNDSDHTHTGEILGTPSYMAPEQAEGRKDEIGPATDVYALGAILYELLAGKPPFLGASPVDSLRLVLTQELTAPTQLVPSLPRDLEAICMKCLEKSPGQRYTTGQALAEDLRRFQNGQPVTARRIRWGQRAWKWVRRHSQGVALGAALLILLLIPVVFLSGHYQHQRQIRHKAQAQAPLVREILHRNCYECHGENPDQIQKDLNILNHAQLLDSVRKVVVPGFPEDSRLIQRIADGSMPPEEDEERLPRLAEIELTILRDWILGGAPPFPLTDDEKIAPSVVSSRLAAKTKEIFHTHCYDCHKYDEAKGGIKILHHRLLITVRKVVVPGRPEESELYELLTTPDKKRRMPRSPYGPMTADEIDTVRQWILEGALPFPKTE